MKRSELRQIIREEIRLIKEDVWQLQSDGAPAMFRFKGKTWPNVTYSASDKTIYARDDNGPRPSKTLSTKDISLNGLIQLLNSGISKPHPDADTLKKFIDRIK